MMEKNLSHSALFSGDENEISDARKGPRYSLGCILAKAEGGIGFFAHEMAWQRSNFSSTTNYKITTMDSFLHADAPDVECGYSTVVQSQKLTDRTSGVYL